MSGAELKRYSHIRGWTLVQVPSGSAEAACLSYLANPNVVYAEPDYEIRLTGIPTDPDFDKLRGLHNTGQTIEPPAGSDPGTPNADIDGPEAWDIWSGDASFRVAVIDTGVEYDHEDLAANAWTNPGETGIDVHGNDKSTNGVDDDGNGCIDDVRGCDFVAGDGDPNPFPQDDPHGTKVAGVIGAVANNGLGVVGVNWSRDIVALKAIAGASTVVSQTVGAMNYVLANNIKVSNNSYGLPDWWGGGWHQPESAGRLAAEVPLFRRYGSARRHDTAYESSMCAGRIFPVEMICELDGFSGGNSRRVC